jgi:DNA-binding PadR family transcriptional regulator
LLNDLDTPHIANQMHAALKPGQLRAVPDHETLTNVRSAFDRPAKRSRPKPFEDIPVERLRMTKPLHTVLRDLTDQHPAATYGLKIQERTGTDCGTLYPLLKRLGTARWLTSWPEDEQEWLAGAPGRGPGRRRTYYAFTPDGHRAAQQELTSPRTRGKRKEHGTGQAKNRWESA